MKIVKGDASGVDQVEPTEVIAVIEDEMLKFASYDNIKSVCNKYMLSGMSEADIREQIGVIVISELRRHIVKEFTTRFLEKKDTNSNNKLTLSDAETRAAIRKASKRIANKDRNWDEVLHFIAPQE